MSEWHVGWNNESVRAIRETWDLYRQFLQHLQTMSGFIYAISTAPSDEMIRSFVETWDDIANKLLSYMWEIRGYTAKRMILYMVICALVTYRMYPLEAYYLTLQGKVDNG